MVGGSWPTVVKFFSFFFRENFFSLIIKMKKKKKKMQECGKERKGKRVVCTYHLMDRFRDGVDKGRPSN